MGSLTSASAAMKTVLALCCLVAVAFALPQPQFRQRVRNRVTNSNQNPCGNGVQSTCVCPDGSTPGRGRRPCNGQGAPTCSCPGGNTFVPSRPNIRNQIKGLL